MSRTLVEATSLLTMMLLATGLGSAVAAGSHHRIPTQAAARPNPQGPPRPTLGACTMALPALHATVEAPVAQPGGVGDRFDPLAEEVNHRAVLVPTATPPTQSLGIRAVRSACTMSRADVVSHGCRGMTGEVTLSKFGRNALGILSLLVGFATAPAGAQNLDAGKLRTRAPPAIAVLRNLRNPAPAFCAPTIRRAKLRLPP